MSGLPDIGIVNAQVGYSRLGWRVSKDGNTPSNRKFLTRLSPRQRSVASRKFHKDSL